MEVKVLGPLIDKFLVEREHNREPRSKVLSASEIASCARSLVYSLNETQKKPEEPRMLRILDNGNYFHERIEHYVKELAKQNKIKIVIMEERKMDTELNFTGKCDSVVQFQNVLAVKDQDVLLEFKSCNTKKFQMLTQPLDEHIWQVHAYMLLFNVHKALIIYEDKNQHDVKEFLVERNEEMINKIKTKIQMVNRHFKEGTLPDKEYPREDWHCCWCKYFRICWKT